MKARAWGLAATLGLVVGLSFVAVPAQAQRWGNGQVVTCGSVDGKYTRCSVPWRDAQLVKQDSDTRCDRGRNWGFERGAIWVDRGCRGQFAEAGGRPGGPGGPGWGGGHPPGGRDQVVVCGSENNRYKVCPIDLRGARVAIVNNDSDTRCIEGRNWGTNRDGIWVNGGCRGRFAVQRRW
ncbi:DUF3011 domain-containing protein [Pinirhizobacter soli]|uniref:DUF3011 domain-containing protein n=1 Tax=Pinirhizobacter soli TaxID=2786953 RepID=UPI00202A9AC3|nr:DUF3011 domain-containing protein [Pinirhizobacter soli]